MIDEGMTEKEERAAEALEADRTLEELWWGGGGEPEEGGDDYYPKAGENLQPLHAARSPNTPPSGEEVKTLPKKSFKVTYHKPTGRYILTSPKRRTPTPKTLQRKSSTQPGNYIHQAKSIYRVHGILQVQ